MKIAICDDEFPSGRKYEYVFNKKKLCGEPNEEWAAQIEDQMAEQCIVERGGGGGGTHICFNWFSAIFMGCVSFHLGMCV